MDKLCIDTIRTLAMDAVQKANSGHPGTAMALAPVAYTLWQDFLRYDPKRPAWPNRDRFVLSAGHASMLLYALLHLTEVEGDGRPAVTLDDIKNFRQLDSKCPGHPEYRLTTGVEATTGPLGQGCGMSVGMAIAGKWIAQRFNRPDFALFDYDIYVLCSDGDMMEGVSSEAASLAGHLALGNLCWIYDNNHITIEGSTALAFGDDVAARFAAYGWDVRRVDDAEDRALLAKHLGDFRAHTDRPMLIVVNSHIGYGSPHKQDTKEAHGEPLGDEEVRLTKRNYGWPEDAHFRVPDGVMAHFRDGIGRRGAALHAAWRETLAAYRKVHPDLAEMLEAMGKDEAPKGWDQALPAEFPVDPKGVATRTASGKVLNAIAPHFPWLIGGAGDLGSSTQTALTFEGAGDFEAPDHSGRNLHFEIREHAMAAALNGMALSKLRPFGSTYMVFSDYLKPALRISAIMEVPVIYVFTHDSIGVGEDGPTHQPIEHLAMLRAMPGLITLRPADANEVIEAWRVIIGQKRYPVCLILSRQKVPVLDRKRYAPAAGLAYGAYSLADAEDGKPDIILIGTGSEVALCIDAYEALKKEKIKARVVSMPSWELFERQDRAYREKILPPDIKIRLSVEAASVLGWARHVGDRGVSLGMDRFGASAPFGDLQKKFGFTPEKVLAAAKAQLAGKNK